MLEKARLSFYHARLTDAADIWKEFQHLDITEIKQLACHMFSTSELNLHFRLGASYPATPSISDFLDKLDSLDYAEHMRLDPITVPDVQAGVNHFSTQSRGSDNIPQLMISRALPVFWHLSSVIYGIALSREIAFLLPGSAR